MRSIFLNILNKLIIGHKQGNINSHWDKAYLKTDSRKLGWYEESPEPSLTLIEKYITDKNASILNVGAGTSTLVDFLLSRGFENLIVNDFSSAALNILKERIGEKSHKARWIVDDLLNPSVLDSIDAVDLWHDRAVLHFFTEKDEQDKYFSLLKKLVKKGGYAVISVFSPGGAVKCSGLQILPYSAYDVSEKLGNDFVAAEDFKHIYTMPSGDKREYLYTVFRRINN